MNYRRVLNLSQSASNIGFSLAHFSGPRSASIFASQASLEFMSLVVGVMRIVYNSINFCQGDNQG